MSGDPPAADAGASEPLTEHYYELGAAGFDDAENQLLYHYTRADVALDAVLPGGTLRLNPYAAMRDPLEYRELPLMLRYSGKSSPDRLPLREAQELIADLRAEMKILSLTMDATGYEDERLRAFGRGYARPRMWEHYADAHRGVCLAFDAGCLTESFLEEVRRHGPTNCGPVEYTDGGFIVSEGRVVDADGLTEATAAEMLTRHLLRRHRDFWFLKLGDWETEYEYRFVLFSPGLAGPLDVGFGSCLRAIVLGERFDPALVPDALELAEKRNVRLARLEWSSGRPSTIPLN